MKNTTLPLIFGTLGVGYFAATHLRRPSPTNIAAFEDWKRHARDANVALAAGLGAAGVLWLLRERRKAA